MSPESYLLQLFIFCHLGICACFLLAETLLLCRRKTQLHPIAAYRSYLAAFGLATLAPALIVFWQACLIDVFQNTVSINSLAAGASAAAPVSIEEASALVVPHTDSSVYLPADQTAGFALVSNSDNSLHVWDQLSYILSPLLQLSVLVLMVGTVAQWLRILVMLHSTHVLVRRARPARLAAHLQRMVAPVLTSDEITVPMAVGLFRRVILIPDRFLQQLNEDQLRHVLLHENAHHQRRDVLVSLLTRMIGSFYWWNPLLAAIVGKIRLHRELICDKVAVTESSDELGYAQALVDCAKLMLKPRRALLAQEFIGADKELKSRLSQLLDGTASNKQSAILVALPLLLLVLTGTLISQSLAELVQDESRQRVFRQYRLLEPTEGELLLATIHSGDLVGLDLLLQNKTLIDTPIASEGTALIAAIRSGNSDAVNLLLARGADPNQGASRRGNPLILAAALGSLGIMEVLIANGADVNAIMPRDETPLMSAVRHGQLDAARLLIAHGARKDLGVRTAVSDGLEYRTPFSLASTPEMRDLLAGESV